MTYVGHDVRVSQSIRSYMLCPYHTCGTGMSNIISRGVLDKATRPASLAAP
jgi:hypothetical protein